MKRVRRRPAILGIVMGFALLVYLGLVARDHSLLAAGQDSGLRSTALKSIAPTAGGPDAGIDLTAEISINPTVPGAGETTTIRVLVRNKGTSSATTGFYVYLYVDPAQQPPNPTTPDTYFWYLPGLTAGGSSSLERTYTFASIGCNHVIYVWVDKTGRVNETDETNNLPSLMVCVGMTCPVDAYEDDNSCSTAHWATSGTAQTHTFCPVGDQDWVKFTAIGGLTYRVSATNLGAHADPLLTLYASCASPPQFGTGSEFQWVAPASGIYYIRAKHRLDTYGPLTSYDLNIAASGGSGDLYEPDDSCAAARDITTDGTRQTHLFQTAGDQDWVKFSVNSGDSFSIVADHVGTGVSPLISLYSACDQTFGAPLAQGANIQITAQAAQIYYARATNQNPAVYGPEARYDLSVRTIPCATDAFEEDDTKAAAKEIVTTGSPQAHNTCPAGDEDWVRFSAQAGVVYVLQTGNLGLAGDTVLYLYDTDGVTELAHNDDYSYLLASRILWTCPRDGVYYARVRHHNPAASGVDTRYELAISKGRCTPDAYEPDNGNLDARTLVTDGRTQDHNFCADPDQSNLSDHDWVRFDAAGGATYAIRTSNLGLDSDTVVEVYKGDGVTLLATNDDHGPGRASGLDFTAPATGGYFARIRHFDSTHSGSETRYQIAISGVIPPTPTPTPTASPTPSPTVTPTQPPSPAKTLILVNRERVASLYSAAEADALLTKLFDLADHPRVQGAVVQVENDISVATAYSQWTASSSALLDTVKTNAVASAVRNVILGFLNRAPNIEYIVLVGDDRVIPYRRIPEGTLQTPEHQYAPSVTANTTLWSAMQGDLLLTDDFYADREPTTWQGKELYLPDYAIGRLIEQPAEITAFIATFLAGDTTNINQALVAGYDFAYDGACNISDILQNDSITTDDNLIDRICHSPATRPWTGAQLRSKQLTANPRFDLQSLNGHSTHLAAGTPNQDDITAAEIITATTDLSRTLVFSIGCHSGLNDPAALDLAQAFARRGANYVGNTGYGYGGDGIVLTELLMVNFARDLMRDGATEIGKALAAAKRRYYDRLFSGQITPRPGYDAKILMQVVLYGLPMYRVTTGGTLAGEDPFPSAEVTVSVPSAFGSVSAGQLAYRLPGSFGAFGETTTEQGTILALDENVEFIAGEPIQPRFFANAAAPAAGSLHGAILRGGVYTDVVHYNPTIALPINEYVTATNEPAFAASGWYPPVPFSIQSNNSVSSTVETLVAVLGQFNAQGSGAFGVERLYDQMSFGTYYSNSPDTTPPSITYIDGVLNPLVGTASLKVEASDPSGILLTVVAFTDGQGTWRSQELAHDAISQKWTGSIPATSQTVYFVQVVDGAGNAAVNSNKGGYFTLAPPLTPAPGHNLAAVYLPMVWKGE